MKKFGYFLALQATLIMLSLHAIAQIAQPPTDAIAYSSKPANTIFLTNMTADQVKAYYVKNFEYQPEKVTPVADKTSKGYKFYYKHQGSLGWQKYWIKITTINTNDCIAYYESFNPDMLAAPFIPLKAQIGKYNHTNNDFKKVYKQYQHLACRLYRQVPDSSGNLVDEMTVLMSRYLDNLNHESSLMVSGGKGVVTSIEKKDGSDTWDYWLEYLRELDKTGYVTLIEYSLAPGK